VWESLDSDRRPFVSHKKSIRQIRYLGTGSIFASCVTIRPILTPSTHNQRCHLISPCELVKDSRSWAKMQEGRSKVEKVGKQKKGTKLEIRYLRA